MWCEMVLKVGVAVVDATFDLRVYSPAVNAMTAVTEMPV